MPGIIIISHRLSIQRVLASSLCSISLAMPPRKKSLPWIALIIQPLSVPTTKPMKIIASPVSGSCAISKKAASPIVAVNTATTLPKLNLPVTYWVTTMIAPPHPGNAPSAAATGTCQNLSRRKAAAKSRLRNFSMP